MNNFTGTQAEGLADQFPNVPEMIKEAHKRILIKARKEDMDDLLKPFIETSSLLELQAIIELAFERWTSITGCAPRFEDSLVELKEQIKMMKES